jgi:hypothetical protein
MHTISLQTMSNIAILFIYINKIDNFINNSLQALS